MKKIIILTSAMICMLFLQNCKKQESLVTSQNPTDSTLFKSAVDWLNLQEQKLNDTASIAKISTLKLNLLASGITTELLNNKEKLIIIHLKNSFQTLNAANQTTFKNLVLIKTETGELRRGDIIEIIPQNQALDNVPAGLISNIYNNNTNNLNGIFSISSITNQFIYELAYNKGKLSTTKYLTTKKEGTTKANNTEKAVDCISWYEETTTYYDDGSTEIADDYLYTTCGSTDCNTTRLINSTIPFKLECGGGGGSGNTGGGAAAGSSNTASLVETNKIVDSLKNPCLLAIVNAIGDANFKNQIVKLFNDTYVGTGQIANIQFQESTSMTNSDGSARASSSSVDPNTHFWVITLNPDYGTNVSNEFWGSVIIHELAHSFITIYNNTGKPIPMDAEHQIIFQRWINQMSDFLVQQYNISATDATSLALGGLDDILKDINSGDPTFNQQYDAMAQQKYGMSLETAEDKRSQYKDGTKGTQCP